MKYRLTRGKHTRFENGIAVRYAPGDVFEPTDAELVTIRERIEAVEEPADVDSLPTEGEGGDSETKAKGGSKGKPKQEPQGDA